MLHETCHQWFGDLVTMRWFDDLWLKEGFAQYMAYKALAQLEPGSNPWKHFYEDIKPLAYGIDETQGTTPIFQNIANLKDAKSAYGAIVYQKAPAVLKQLNYFLGDEDNFRNGLRLYLKEHAYANAEWADLVGAFEAASDQTRPSPGRSGLGQSLDHSGAACHRSTVDWSCKRGTDRRIYAPSAGRPETRLRLAHGLQSIGCNASRNGRQCAPSAAQLASRLERCGIPRRPRGHRPGLPQRMSSPTSTTRGTAVPARPRQSIRRSDTPSSDPTRQFDPLLSLHAVGSALGQRPRRQIAAARLRRTRAENLPNDEQSDEAFVTRSGRARWLRRFTLICSTTTRNQLTPRVEAVIADAHAAQRPTLACASSTSAPSPRSPRLPQLCSKSKISSPASSSCPV